VQLGTCYISVVVRTNNVSLSLCVAITACAMLLCAVPALESQQIPTQTYSGMRWRMIGPFRGGRSVAATGITGDRDTYYFGAVAGGVWKTTNAGRTWSPIFDSVPIASVGALAVAPSDPNTIYVGTGEADIRSDISFGDGVYKSTDAGRTWQHIGLDDTRQIGRILVDPHDPNTVLVAALGHAYGPNSERGVFRTTDGGATWTRVLYKDEDTGAIDLAMDPADSNIVFATLWNAHRPPWSTYAPIEGPGSGIYKSTDGGITWKELSGNGLPTSELHRIGLAMARAAGHERVYALIDAKEGSGLYRSDDGGEHWQLAGKDPRITQRQWYFGEITVDPKDPDVVYVSNVSLYRSSDGGKTFEAIKGAPGGDDYHFLWISPDDSRRMIVASDQGTVVSVDGGKTWSSWYNQPTAQLYHVSTDNRLPYFVYGAQQDSGTVATASRSDYGSITYRDWYSVGAGESGYIVPDPSNPRIVYGGNTYGGLFRFDKRTGQSQNISPTAVNIWGTPMPEQKLRFTWTSPLAFSPQNPNTIYFGSQYVLKTDNAGMTWRAISPDLTGTDPDKTGSGPLTVANAEARGYGVVYTIAPSPVKAGEVWAGTDTGLIQLTLDDGKTWSNVTPPGLSAWSKISLIDASHFDAGTAYAAIDRHRLEDFSPHIFRTHDGGETWQEISSGIPPTAFVRAVREDPVRKGLLYAGTELGVFVSFDDGDHWQPLQLNLPVTPIHDLVVHGDDLVAATHGRSFWILDDLTPLRQLNAKTAQSSAFLFQPQNAIRIRANVNRDTPLPPETPAGQNPPTGAIIDYYLAAPAKTVAIEIVDATGAVVRRYSSNDKPAPPTVPPPFPNYWLHPQQPPSTEAGMHRFTWDFRYTGPDPLNTEYQPVGVFGQTTPRLPLGPLALPGQYKVRLIADGHTLTAPLSLTMDPRVNTSPEGLAQQFHAEQRISNALQQAYQTIRDVEAFRAQLSSQLKNASLNSHAKHLDTVAAALLTAPATGLESVAQQLNALFQVVDSADRAPTQQATQALHTTLGKLNAQLAAWQKLKQPNPGESVSGGRQ
jgi:photosystem II stability/assembly factor-like uncharacterized protein